MSSSIHPSVPLREPAPQERASAHQQSPPQAPAADRNPAGRLPVIVLSGGVTGLGVLRTFARQGIPSYVYAAEPADPIRRSRWYRSPPGTDEGAPSSAPSVGHLQSMLEESGFRGAFLCACSDDWNRVVAAFADQAPTPFVSMAPARVALEIVQNKANLALLLQTLGVPMPNTLPVANPRDILELPPANGTFYFLKPRDSQSFREHFGTKGIRVSTADEARRWLEVIASADMRVVLQEYIPGPASEHYFVDGYVDRAGAVKALFARRRLRIYPPDFGNSTSMVSIPLAEVEPAVDSVRRVLAAADYRGIFSVEFKRDPRDGGFKLLEINARPWWFVDFAVRCGVDVCRMAYEDAQGREVRTVESYSVGTTCIFPYYDFFATRTLIAAGRMSWRRWCVEVVRALQPVACFDDPMPVIVASARVVGKAVRNRLSGRAP